MPRLLLIALCLAMSCGGTPVPLQRPDQVAEPGAPFTLAGAGDIGQCGSPGPEATARLLAGIPGIVFTVGDNVYPYASLENFHRCYGRTWGRHFARTRPSPGNHDWEDNASEGYFNYFGSKAGPRGPGYYSYRLGNWQVLSLNSNLRSGAGSRQHTWVRDQLAATQASCILAYWHKPVYSSGPSGGDSTMRDIWRLLHAAGAELVLGGHDHMYERFAPQDADGRLDPERGIRQFVVGTGGYKLYEFGPVQPNSEVRDNQTWGVLTLTLHQGSYDWEFVPVAGKTFRDAGSATCSP